jgi:hypothetical protein
VFVRPIELLPAFLRFRHFTHIVRFVEIGRTGDRIRLGAVVPLLVLEAGAVAALHRLGSMAPFDLAPHVDAWARAEPGDALAAALRWVALGAATWLFGLTLLTVLAGALGARRAARLGVRALPRVVRRVVDRALTTGVAAAIVIAPTAAAARTTQARPQPPVVTVVRDGRGPDLRSLPAPAAPTPSVPSAPPAPPAPAPVRSTPRTVVVTPGDNLWELAAAEIADATGRDRASVADGEIAPYWWVVCEANRARLASGDEHLVHPGEEIVLPPLT